MDHAPFVPSLLNATVPRPDFLPAVRRRKRAPREADAALWAALERQHTPGLQQALEDGANPHRRRNGYPPFWVAVQMGRLDLAEILVNAGANPLLRGRSNETAWAALSARDDPAEAERLKEIMGGTDSIAADCFLKTRSDRLLVWWLQDGGQTAERFPKFDRQNQWVGCVLREWVLAILRDPPGLWDMANEAWGVRPANAHGRAAPQTLAAVTQPGMAALAWEEIANRDDVDLAKRALAQGWGPPPAMALTSFNQELLSELWEFGLGWVLLSKRAWHVWSWWHSVPALAEDFQATGRAHPAQTLFGLVKDAPTLDRFHRLGIDLSVRDTAGNTLAHHVFAGKFLRQPLVDWWVTHRPEDLDVRNGVGQTPWDVPSADPKLLAKIKAKRYASAWKTSTAAPRRTRL